MFSTALPGIDLDRITDWIQRNVPAITLPISMSIISAGRSNLIYEVRDSNGIRYVLRRPPLGDGAAGTHDVKREWEILTALKSSPIPTPSLVALCEDVEVLGAPFFLMNFVPGSPLNFDHVQHMTLPARMKVCASMAQALGLLHTLDINQVGLGNFRRPRSYVERQVVGWLRRLDAIGDLVPSAYRARMLTTGNHLVDHRPDAPRESIVHGDFKADNIMLDGNGQVTAILDWELTAVGDPLVDLGWLMIWWGDDDHAGPWLSKPVNNSGQLNSSYAIAELYSAETGIGIDNLDYYKAFAYWRLCAINTLTRARFVSGAMVGKHLDIGIMDAQLDWQLQASQAHLGN
ncbi:MULTISPECIES: phosphotransferase family protein [Rhodococcus]|uniref:phosphotransferase family protein n=1 Tax=Rhodococcus TaxID=1827 RepID=UPI0015628800|nr:MULTISPECIES: phosphotransferase family protein [Rhodococcus]MCE4265375.1 phosphotransferase family protein [Rhodococcus globerulus]